MIEGTIDRETEDAEILDGVVSGAGVTLRERSERNGHYPGVVYIGNRAEIGAKVERALFERGFATVHVNGRAIAPEGIGDVLRVALDTGCIVIFSGPAEARRLNGTAFFDAASLVATESGAREEVDAVVLAFAQTLKLRPTANDPKKVN